MKKWDVIIAGAGYGGLCAGALLAGAGKKVLILEKENVLGGLAKTLHFNGHALDDGAHMPAYIGHLDNIFSELGLPFPEFTLINKAEIFHGNRWMEVKDIFPLELYKEAMKIMMSLSPHELALLDDIPLNEWVEAITVNPEMKRLFFYFGCVTSVGNRYHTYSAGEMLYILREIVEMGKTFSENGRVVRGGMKMVAEPLAQFIRDNGGEIRLNTPVESVVIERGRAAGVRIEKDERIFHSRISGVEKIKAETVIATLPLWDLFCVLDENDFPAWWRDWLKWLGTKVSHVWSIIYSLDEPPFDPRAFRWIEKMPFTDNAGIFFQMPGYSDDGQTHQFHTCYQGHYDEFPDLFNIRSAGVRAKSREVIEMLERETFELFPQVKDSYNWKIAHAGIYGIAQSPGLVGDKRPSMKAPGVPNLYLVSSTVREARGIGIAATAKCARMAVDDILKGQILPGSPRAVFD